MNAEVPRSITSGSPSIGKPNAIGLVPSDRLGAAQRRDHRRRRHRVDADQAGARRHLDVVGAAAAHPDVVDADEREAVRAARARSRRASRGTCPSMPFLLPPSKSTDTLGLPSTRIGLRGALKRGMVGDVEQLRQAGVLVAAQRRVDDVVGEDARVLGRRSRSRAWRARTARAPRRRSGGHGRWSLSACWPYLYHESCEMTRVGIIGGLGPESTIDYYRRILEAWEHEDPGTRAIDRHRQPRRAACAAARRHATGRRSSSTCWRRCAGWRAPARTSPR